jgi:hypothetical protein
MPDTTLELDGRRASVRRLELSARLDGGTEAAVTLWERPDGIRRGAPVRLRAGGTSFELVVAGFRVPARGSAELALIDPIRAARPFRNEAFSEAGKQTTFAAPIRSRVPLGGTGNLASAAFDAILLHDLTLEELLGEVCARHDRWHFRWREGKVELGPLAATPVLERDGADFAETEEGFTARVAGTPPCLGSRLRLLGRTGHVLVLRVVQAEHGPVACEATWGEPANVTPLAERGIRLVPACVEETSPLLVRAAFGGGAEARTRARLLSLKTHAGRCRLALPIAKGDQLRLVWPAGVFAGCAEVWPFDEVAPTEGFEMHAEEARAAWKLWNVTADRVDIAVREHVDIHE